VKLQMKLVEEVEIVEAVVRILVFKAVGVVVA
jgi:hypothetical protein